MEEIKNKMYCVKKGEAGYPKRLLELAGMPEQLYFYGRLPDDEKPSIAIVGARMCSSYGRIQSFSYGKFVSRAGEMCIRDSRYRESFKSKNRRAEIPS